MRVVVQPVVLFHVLLAITWAEDLTAQLELHGLGGHFKRIGQLSIDKADMKQEKCQTIDADVCRREAAGDYAYTFPMYESRYEECGLAGWKTEGILGRGHVSAVALRDTPCGLDVAMKGTHSASTQEDINLDCKILQMLMRYQNDPRCNACFPKYYFLSNYTGVCYAEHVISVPIAVYFDHINANSTAGFQHVRKAFVEGLGALSVLQEAGVKHRDLSFRNMLIRLPSRDSKEYRVVILDFGSSASATLGGHSKGNPDLLGNHGKNDAHAYACSFIGYFYPKHQAWCKQRRLGAFVDVGRPGSFERFLADIVQANDDRHMTAPVNYDALLAAFANVTSL